MAGFQSENVSEIILDTCKDKTKCSVEIPTSLTNIDVNLRSYDQFLFAQVSCEQDKDHIFFKSHMGLIVACFGVIICWFFRFSMRYVYNLDELNGVIYDLNLITVSDYTVSSYIDPAVYRNFI